MFVSRTGACGNHFLSEKCGKSHPRSASKLLAVYDMLHICLTPNTQTLHTMVKTGGGGGTSTGSIGENEGLGSREEEVHVGMSEPSKRENGICMPYIC